MLRVGLGGIPFALLLISLLVVAAIGGTFLIVRLGQTLLGNSAYAESSAGLRLYVSLNSSVLGIGQSVNISIQEYNPLARSVNISSSNRWPASGLSLGPCGTLNFPMGLEVYAGYLTRSNVFLEIPLPLYSPGARFCPMILSYIQYFIFQPETDAVQVFGSCTPNPCITIPMATHLSVGGFWLASIYVNFPPGIYTVAAGDEWGSMVLPHFTVTF